MSDFENMMRDNMLKTRVFKIPEDITDPKHRVFWWNERRCIVSAKEAAQFLEDKIKELEAKNGELETWKNKAKEKMPAMQMKIHELEKKLEIAVEALELYANKENWHYNNTSTVCSTGHKAHGYNVFLFESDCEKQDDTVKEMNVFSGCIAREALAAINGDGV